MTYAFTYIDLATGDVNMETSANWNMWWDYERRGEIRILRIEGTTDDWEETCFVLFESEA